MMEDHYQIEAKASGVYHRVSCDEAARDFAQWLSGLTREAVTVRSVTQMDVLTIVRVSPRPTVYSRYVSTPMRSRRLCI